MKNKSIYAIVGCIALIAAIVYSISTFNETEDSSSVQAGLVSDVHNQAESSATVEVVPDELDDDAGTSRTEFDDLPPSVQQQLIERAEELNRQNAEFRAEHPAIVANSVPQVCEPGEPALFCSELYAHRGDPRLEKHYGEPGYTESFVQCGEQRDYWRTDGKHPDGEQVVVFLECDEGKFIGPSPTPAPGS